MRPASKSFPHQRAAVLIVPAGTAAYALYCWRAVGDPWKFVHIQAVWSRELSWPWDGAQRAVAEIEKAAVDDAIFQPLVVLSLIDLAALLITVILLVLSVLGPWTLGLESLYLVVFAYASLILVLVSPIGLNVPLHGVPRYVLDLARLHGPGQDGRQQARGAVYLVPAIAVQGVLLLAFYKGAWLS